MDITTVAIITLPLITLTFLFYVGWREKEHRIQVNELTSKIMSKNYVEFATYRPEETKVSKIEPVVAKPKRMLDASLGSTY